MGRRRTMRLYNEGFDFSPKMQGSLWLCKSKCDLQFPWNKTKRLACKADCEKQNIDDANLLYPPSSSGGDYPPSGYPPSYPPPPPTGGGFGINQNDLLLYGGAAALLFFMMSNKKKKRR